MRKSEFLEKLAENLRGISDEERAEALNYYSEYLDEAGEENEEAAIEELGGPETVARIIRANTASQPGAAKAEAPRAAQAAQTPPPPRADRAAHAQPVYTAPVTPPPEARLSHTPAWVWILIGVLLIPVGVGLIGAVIGVVFGVIGFLIGLLASGVGFVFAGAVLLVKGVLMLASYPAGALYTLGGGLLAIGIGLALTAASVWVVAKGVPFVKKYVCTAIDWIKRKVREWR